MIADAAFWTWQWDVLALAVIAPLFAVFAIALRRAQLDERRRARRVHRAQLRRAEEAERAAYLEGLGIAVDRRRRPGPLRTVSDGERMLMVIEGGQSEPS